MPETPQLDLALVEYLERLFPDRCPQLSMNDKEVWFAAGQAHVARHLRALLKQQQENVLESTNVLRR